MKKFILAVSLLALTGCSIVGPGEKGVRLSFGKASDEVLDPGAHLWVPFAMGVKLIDTRIQKSEYETNASSKDMQTVVTKFAVNWRINSDSVVKVYKTIGTEEDVLNNILEPALSETLKASTSKKTAEEILSKREDLKNEIDSLMAAKMKPYGLTIESINITNVSFSHDFSQAIEAKQVAEQEAKQAHYTALKAEQDAISEVNKAKGQAEAQKLLRLTLSPELLQLKALEKWDGHFPGVMGSSTLPFINVTPGKGN